MSNFRVTLNALAQSFAMSLVQALRGASLEELRAFRAEARPAPAAAARVARPKPAKPPSRDAGRDSKRKPGTPVPENLARRIAQHLRTHPGLSGDAACAALGVTKRRWRRGVAVAIATGLVRTKGRGRATTYHAT